MKLGRLIVLNVYKARRQMRQKLTDAAAVKPLPTPDQLWELLDRSISLDAWKKR